MAGRFSVEAVFRAVDRVTAPVSRMQNRVGKFTRSMSRGLRKVNRMVGKVTGGLFRMARGAAKLGGLAIAAGIAATALAINKVATAADELAKRTRRIQFPIKEFQEWQFVAEQSGLNVAEFDKSMEKFTKTVGEARAGTGTLFTILNKTNKPLLKQLTNAENSADAFELYLDAIRKTENQLDKTALATSAFGRTGAKFLNITEQSTAAVEALRKEQRENGVITAQSAAAAEAYNDAVNSLKRSLGGLLQGVILPMLPAMTETVRGWRDWIAANREMIASRVIKFVKGMRDGIGRLIEKVRGLNESRSLFEQLTKVVKFAGRAFNFLIDHGATILKIVAALTALSIVLKVVAIATAAVNLAMSLNPVGLMIIGITSLIALLAVVASHWDDIKASFSGFEVPDFLQSGFGADFDPDANLGAPAPMLSFAGSGFDAGFDPDASPSVVSPQERTARSIDEQRTTSSAEVTVTAGQGTTAEVTQSSMGQGLKVQQSGAF